MSEVRTGWVNLSEETKASFGRESLTFQHGIHKLPLFSDDTILSLLENYPRHRLQVFTMGDDELDRSQWQPVDTQGASGSDILHAVQVGRLWVKLMRLDQFDPQYKELVDGMFDDIGEHVPQLESFWTRPLLLISSPNALVYYHLDAQATMLWQISGVKRVWTYPADDERFIEQELLEGVFSGEIDEEAPYLPEFDEHARVFELHPGDALSWPLNGPHRVTNRDCVNVSLSVPFGTLQAEQRGQLLLANQLLRRRFGVRRPSKNEASLGAFFKRNGFRVARKLGLTPLPAAGREPYLAECRVDSASATGISRIAGGPVNTPF